MFDVDSEYGFIISFEHIIRDYDEETEDEYFELEYDERKELSYLSDSEIDALPSLSEVICIRLFATEIYGIRDSVDTESFSPKSVSKILYLSLNEMYKIQPSIVLDYRLDTNEGFDNGVSMCDVGEYFNYLFIIYIKCNELQLTQAIESFIKINNAPPCVSKYIINEYAGLRKIDDSRKVKILNTNTKTRRLGYINLLGRYFLLYPQTPSNQFAKKFERYVISFQDKLNEVVNSKGVIASNKKGLSTGVSAKPYIELSNSLGFVNDLNRVITISKKFKVYAELLKFNLKDNPFKLNLLDICFLSESIMVDDFLYISILLEIVYTRENVIFSNIKEIFRMSVLRRLKYFQQDYFGIKYKQATLEINKIENRINAWEKPDRYLEHVLMPRLNWLSDCDLVRLSTNDVKGTAISITNQGKIFFECICDWYDLQCDWIVDPNGFIDLFYPNVIAQTFKIPNTENIDYDLLKKIIPNMIDNCFEIFKTMTYNRITLSQTIKYVQYSLLLDYGYQISSTQVDRMIQEDFSELFVYKYQQQFKDGYIQKLTK